MKLGKALRAIALLGPPLLTQASSGSYLHLRRSLQTEETYATRVSNIDKTYAQCIAGGESNGGEVSWTEINYYYTIEASSAVDQEKEDDLESILYMLIQTAVLWCTLPKAPGIDVSGSGRKLQAFVESEEFASFQSKHRTLSRQEARRMSIIAINNNPADETADGEFTPSDSPCQFSTYPVCTVMQGRMGITANTSDNLDLIIASILDAIQEAMTLDLLIEPLCTEDPCVVEKVVYWGDSLEQVQSNVEQILVGNTPPGNNGNGGDGNNVVTDPPSGDDDDDDDDGGAGTGGDGDDDDDDDDDDSSGPGTGGDGDDDDDDDDDDSSGPEGGEESSTTDPKEDGAGGAGNGTSPVDPDKPSISESNEAEASNNDDNSQLFLIAAVPLAVLVAFMLLVARERQRRLLMTPAELAHLEDYILVGTGDPPRSFHEGMYHYTRAGARYLSTNCPECHETRKMGMMHSFSDLPTINENHLYSGRSLSYSYEESSVDTAEVEGGERNSSFHRRRYFVEATEDNLGKKASTVDVHKCSSATCRICAYKPKDVTFLESYPEDATMNYLPSTYSEDNSSNTSGRNYVLRSQNSI